MPFEFVERAVESRDLQRDAGREQAHALHSDAPAFQYHANIDFDAFPAPEEMRYGFFVQWNLQSSADISQEWN